MCVVLASGAKGPGLDRTIHPSRRADIVHTLESIINPKKQVGVALHLVVVQILPEQWPLLVADDTRRHDTQPKTPDPARPSWCVSDSRSIDGWIPLHPPPKKLTGADLDQTTHSKQCRGRSGASRATTCCASTTSTWTCSPRRYARGLEGSFAHETDRSTRPMRMDGGTN